MNNSLNLKSISILVNQMLKKDVSFVEGVIELVSLSSAIPKILTEEEHQMFQLILSECDGLPFGKVRQYWSVDSIEKMKEELIEADNWAFMIGKNTCLNLLQRIETMS